MYPCHQSHKHAFRTSYRHIACFPEGDPVLKREMIHVECILVIVSEMTRLRIDRSPQGMFKIL